MKCRNVKKFFATGITVCLLCYAVPAGDIQAQTVETNGRKLERAIKEQAEEVRQTQGTEEEKQANEKYVQVMKTVTEKDENGEIVYEDYYAGVYLNEEGSLVVQMANAEPEEVKKIENAAGGDVVIEKVDHSYEELKNIYSKISNQFASYVKQQEEKGIADAELNKLISNMTGVFIDEASNEVVVLLQKYSAEAMAQFEKYYGKMGVVFQEEEAESDHAQQLKLGMAIYTSDGKQGSVGMRAYYVNKSGTKIKGFVTAAHLFKGIGDPVYIRTSSGQRNKIGVVAKWKYGGTMDAAFVRITNNNYVPSRKVYYSDSKGSISDKYTLESYSYLSETYVGATLYKSGSSTYLTKGRVTSTSKTIKSSDTNVVFQDLWQASYDCGNGDSGGAVFDINFNCIAGIHRGSSGTSTKWENISDLWSLHEY